MYESEFGDPERNFQIIWFLATYFVNVDGEKGVNFETRLHNEYLLPIWSCQILELSMLA
jgi:hypothetical protein